MGTIVTKEETVNVNEEWNRLYNNLAKDLGRADFTLALTVEGYSIALSDGWKTGPASLEEVSARVKRLQPTMGEMSRTMIALGFEDEQEFFRMVSNVRLTHLGDLDAFKRWQHDDGTKAGLTKLPVRES